MATLLHSESRRLYSWWWDSHISPKNSKWLQENLTDMDAKVKAMIKLIEEDADSFARRAEMYYKKRPELMKLVEEFYRAYRALAERYNHATGELQQAHRTMAEAFPNQVPFVLAEDSSSGSSTHEAEPHTPEMTHPIRALLDPDDLHKDALGLSASNIHAFKKDGLYSGDSDSGISKKGLKQLHEMLGAGEVVPQNSKFAGGRVRKDLNHELEAAEQNSYDAASQLSNENQNLKDKVFSESERACKAESEVENLKKSLAYSQDEKEAVVLQYQQCLEKLSRLEGELNCAQKDSMRLNELASKAESEVHTLKEALVKLETEKNTVSMENKECMEKISKLECSASQAQTDAKGLNERAIKAESEAQYMKNELFRFESENEAGLIQYKQCLDRISDLENKLSVAENYAKLLNEQADRAESEVRKLKEALAEMNKEKEAAAFQYEHCLKKISQLETKLYCAQEDVKHLNSEILIGAAKLKSAEENCVLLETSNMSLRHESDDLVKKIVVKDQELLEKHEELDKLQICIQDESLRYVQVEATLQTLQNLHSQSQVAQGALTLELKNGLQMLKDLEMSKHGLEIEVQRIKNENQNLNELNISSNISMKNMQDEIVSLRDMKEKLEEKVALQMGESNSLQKEICQLKGEIKGLNRSYQALVEQVESVGLNPECIGSLVKDLQVENSNLREICENDRDEKEALFKKLGNREELLKKNAVLESTLSDVNGELEGTQEKVRALQETCHVLHGEKSALVAEKAALLSQLQIITENMQKLLEKNTILENSLSGANVELQGLRAKSQSLEDICQFLNKEKSNLLTERGTLVIQLENVEKILEKLEKRFTGFEEKYAGLEMEKESSHSQVQELKVYLSVEKQERASFTMQSETRLANLENHIHLLQEESRWRKKEFEEELDGVVNAQFEIFILQKFIQDMEEKNYSLLIECQKHVEASKLTEKLISELERENLEQQVEAELFLDEIEKLRLGIYQVFKALEIGTDSWPGEKTENEQVFLHHILGNIEDIKCSLSKYEDEKQQLLVENSVLISLLGQLKLEGVEVESEKKILDRELKIMREQLLIMQNDKYELLELNRQLRSEVSKGDQQVGILKAEVKSLCESQDDLQRAYLELQEEYSQMLEENRLLLNKLSNLKEEKCMAEEENDVIFLEALALDNLLAIFKTFGTEKDAELKLLSDDLHYLQGVNIDHEKQVGILRWKLEMKETENLLLKDSIERLEMDLYGVRESNEQLKQEISSGKDLLSQRDAELLEAQQKFKATDSLKSELCTTVEELKMECEESKTMRENLEKQILELSEDNTSQNKEIECLCEVNGNLASELSMLRKEIEEQRTVEENLSSELQERNNDFELWEAEATSFYFDLQISSIHEVLFENKFHELTGLCESLEDESASKSLEIEQMKERVGIMECEIEGLKAQLFAYTPVIVSLRDNIASLEQNTLSKTKLIAANDKEPKNAEVVIHPHEESCQGLLDDKSPPIPNGISDLQELQTKIKTVEKILVKEKNKLAMRESLNTNIKLEAAMKEIEELKSRCSSDQEKGKEGKELSNNLKLQKTKPEISEVGNGIMMKDIPLDQVSDDSIYGISRRAKGGADDQMLELWETAEEDFSLGQTGNESQKQIYEPTEKDIVYHQFEDVRQKSENPSSELEVEKELGVDKLEVSTIVDEPNREGKNRKILERLASDAQKLASLQITVRDLRRKLEMNKKSKKAKDVDIETVKEQLREVEETAAQLVDLNGKLTKNVEESPSASAQVEQAVNVRTKRVSEQARKGSEKIGRLQLEVQKLQYVLLKLEDEQKSKGRCRFSRSKTSIILRDFIYIGRKSSVRKKKTQVCGCFRPSTNGQGNMM